MLKTYKEEKRRIPKICIRCGKHFKAKRDTAKYCCQQCMILSQRERHQAKAKSRKNEPRLPKICASCGQPFIDTSRQNNQKYCSNGCIQYKYENANLFASCPACDTPAWLVIHHKDFNPKNNRPENKEYICKGCHNIRHKIHKSKIKNWERKDVERSFHHFNRRYADKGGIEALRQFLNNGAGTQSEAAKHFNVSRELVRQWKLIYQGYLCQSPSEPMLNSLEVI